MKISNAYNLPSFRSRCPEVKLGQDVCHLVNSEFPHYSLSKFKPLIEKGISQKVVRYKDIHDIVDKHDSYCPGQCYNPIFYFTNLFDSIKKHHYFECHESAYLSELILKLNGIKNAYTASVKNGDAEIKHVVCLFNRDGSEIAVNNEKKDMKAVIENNKTIIVDTWAGICDFAGKVFKEYGGFWSEHLKPTIFADRANGKYTLINLDSLALPDTFLNSVRTYSPELKL